MCLSTHRRCRELQEGVSGCWTPGDLPGLHKENTVLVCLEQWQQTTAISGGSGWQTGHIHPLEGSDPGSPTTSAGVFSVPG